VALCDALGEAEGVTDGTAVTDGDPLSGFAGSVEAGPTAAAELAGSADIGVLGRVLRIGVLRSGGVAGVDATTDCSAPAWL
jgi:hypothetical protein